MGESLFCALLKNYENPLCLIFEEKHAIEYHMGLQIFDQFFVGTIFDKFVFTLNLKTPFVF